MTKTDWSSDVDNLLFDCSSFISFNVKGFFEEILISLQLNYFDQLQHCFCVRRVVEYEKVYSIFGADSAFIDAKKIKH